MGLWATIVVIAGMAITAVSTVAVHGYLLADKMISISKLVTVVLITTLVMLAINVISSFSLSVVTYILLHGTHEIRFIFAGLVSIVNFFVQITVAIYSDEIYRTLRRRT